MAPLGALLLGPFAAAGEPTPADRGRAALLGRSFGPPIVSVQGYNNVWKQWGVKEKPADYAAAFAARYGLAPAPYDNGGLPMGLREAAGLFGIGKGITADCMLCHAGSIAGQSCIGMVNASVDIQSLFEELAAADGVPFQMPYRFGNVRGGIEASATVAFLLAFREPDLKVRPPVDLGPLHDQTCEDIPAWWTLKKKKTMYHGGEIDARSMRSLMTFMLSPLNGGDYIKKQEPVFKDIKAYMLSLEAPKYPFPIDDKLAARGKGVFERTCSRCHGTYGPDWTYPNKVVNLEIIGTDRTRAESGNQKVLDSYNASWFGQEKGPDGLSSVIVDRGGYQAPPLDGIWATAPYFHNGSVPTVYQVLNSKARPKVFTRSYRTDKEDYDPQRLGWKITVLDKGPDPGLPSIERRKVYDTTQPGRGNGGHTFGDKLSEEERMAVIEYLKTL
jgi:mono/diheme cytochrome c family protein